MIGYGSIIRIGYGRGYVWKGRVVLGYGRTSRVELCIGRVW